MYVLGFPKQEFLFSVLVSFSVSPLAPMTAPRHHLRRAEGRDLRGLPALSPQLQRLARFALDKPHDLALGTVAAVAQANAVQPSSMIRFANALGFDGFSQMQQVFRSHLVERSAPLPRAHPRRCARGGEDGDAGVLHHASSARRSASCSSSRSTSIPARSTRPRAPRQRAADPCARAAARLSGRLLPRLRAQPARAAGAPARRPRRHARRVRARASAPATCCSSPAFATTRRPSSRRALASRAARRLGDRDHRQRPVAAEAGRRRLLRARRRFDAAVPLAGRAALPRAGARRQHRAPPGARRRDGQRGRQGAASAGRAGRWPRSGRPFDVVCMGRAAVDLYGEQIGGRLEDMRSFAQVPRRLAGQHRGRRGAARPEAGDADARRRRAQRPLRARDARRRRRRRQPRDDRPDSG